MRSSRFILVVASWVCLTCGTGCGREPPRDIELELGPRAFAPQAALGSLSAAAPARKALNPRLLRRFLPLRVGHARDGRPATAAQVDLGRKLYFETRLSKSGTLSCNSCHPLDRFGTDGHATSPGHDGQRGTRNTPTVYNVGGFFAQFWDGRAIDVEEQAQGPILNPIEMGMRDATQVERMLSGIPDYVVGFRNAFPDDKQPLTYARVGSAIGAFERGLVTPSRWDAYLAGDQTALTNAELEGLLVFTNVGCMVCHTGEFLGGSMFQKVGAVEPWPNQTDQGRYQVTKDERDRMVFKVPTLRNIEKTAPYFHDGSIATLREAVHMMGKHQLGLELTDEEVTSIETWLQSLTGPLPIEYIKPPRAPGT